MFLPCDACGDTDGTCRCGWKCKRCGEKVQENWWCTACQKMLRLCIPCRRSHADRHEEAR